MLDALIRSWAELGEPDVPTRIAWFPPGAVLRRRDVTGLSGGELTAVRHELDVERGIGSTVLIERGARRWLIELDWDDDVVRRIETLAERAGFAEVVVEPAPIALARALQPTTTSARRNAAPNSSFEYVADDGIPLAAAAYDEVGTQPPELTVGTSEIPPGWFDQLAAPDALRSELRRLVTDAQPAAPQVVIAAAPLASAPAPDLRSPIRQCVSVGAAAAAAGLLGRVHPVDTVTRFTDDDLGSRPWAIERVSELPDVERPTIGTGKRWITRILPRRR
jgi:hypothetical protein